jgi:hypothetical protein
MKTEQLALAREIAEQVYDDFLQQVVIQYVIEKDKIGPLKSTQKKRVDNQTHIDDRIVRLMSISGKGGWHQEKQIRDNYAQSTNITLLDHLLSVTRGSLLLYTIYWFSDPDAIDNELLRKKLYVIAVVAFLHDANKILFPEFKEEESKERELGEGRHQLKSAEDVVLEASHIKTLMERYGIQAFIKEIQIEDLTEQHLLYLIQGVESGQKFRELWKKSFPSYVDRRLHLCIRMADTLDGIWLKDGIQGVLERLKTNKSCFDNDLLKWKAIDLYDPHNPFLLDELQRQLSVCSEEIGTGVPPLIELHHDGHLFMLLPEEKFDEVVEAALQELCDDLPFGLELKSPKPGYPRLLNSQPSHEQLQRFINKLLVDRLGQIFLWRYDPSLETQLNQLLSPVGLKPRLSKKPTRGKLTSLYTNFEKMDEEIQEWIRRGAYLSLMLNLTLDENKRQGTFLTPKQREEALLECVKTIQSNRQADESYPEFISAIADKDGNSRRVLTAIWVVKQAIQDKTETLKEAIWGDDGLLKHWLEDEPNGFKYFLPKDGKGEEIGEFIKYRFRQLLNGERVIADETLEGRCLLTDEPVNFNQPIDTKNGLYGILKSAFSGRDRRPELLISYKGIKAKPNDGYTLISPVSEAEYKLRATVYGNQKGDFPVLIYSPSTVGFFGGLVLNKQDKKNQNIPFLSLYDLSRLEIKKGNVLYGPEMYQGRIRIARFEYMPERLFFKPDKKETGQLIVLRLILKAALRTGRPIHVFRGLPTTRREFFYYDALPRLLENLIGATDKGLRLEQIPSALEQLEMAEEIIKRARLGYEMLHNYANPSTRFSSTCFCWSVLCDELQLEKQEGKKAHLKRLMGLLKANYLKGENMTESDSALVELGRKAAGIQQYAGVQSSNNVQMLVFHTCMDALEAARKAPEPIDDDESLIYGIGGRLLEDLVRKRQAAKNIYRDGDSLFEGCKDVAEWFVKKIWHGVMKRKSISQNTLRMLGSIYRMAFLETQSHSYKEENEKKDNGVVPNN